MALSDNEKLQYERLTWELRTLQNVNHSLWTNRSDKIAAIRTALQDLLADVLPFKYEAGQTVRVKANTYGNDALMYRLHDVQIKAGTILKVVRVEGHYHSWAEVLYVEISPNVFCYIPSNEVELV